MRLERRDQTSLALIVAAPLAAILISLILSGGLIAMAGANPFDAYVEMIRGAFGSRLSISETLTRTTPLILTGLAAAVAFRARLWNIGGEGQLYLGALAAAWLGHGMTAALPAPLAILIILLAGMVAGALLLLGPVLLRIRFGVDEGGHDIDPQFHHPAVRLDDDRRAHEGPAGFRMAAICGR